MSITPNSYQRAILDWIENGRGHAVVEAVAGSGKSSTLVMASKAIKGSGLFLAFNKSIATELGDKLSGLPVDVRTIHSLGFAAVRGRGRKVKVKADKYRKILKALRELPPRNLSDHEYDAVREYGWPNCNRLVDLCRSNLVDAADRASIKDLISFHALDVRPELYDLAAELAGEAMKRGLAQADFVVDFGDMIWLPSQLNLSVDTYPWVMVDEAQDLSVAQFDVVSRAIAPGGRVLAVGDRRQAIYGFAGADAASFQGVIDRLDAKVLPLSVCYRCPVSHLDLAREICPQIEPAPDAKHGEIVNLDRDKLTEFVREGDMVICRKTAPLLKVAYECIGSGISAAVKGREIGKGLAKLAKAVTKLCSWDGFAEGVERWADNEREALVKAGRDSEALMESIADRAECLLTIYTCAKPKDLDAMLQAIEDLFATDRPSVLCSTVHRAKGLENERVVLLNYGEIELPAKRAWQAEQERNLHYVALTRAKETLVLC